MKYIEIRDGISINTDKIEAIERAGQLQSHIYIGGVEYLANFPYETLIQLLGREDTNIREDINTLAKSSTFFAG